MEGTGVEWRGGEGREGEGRVPDCLGGLPRPWNGQPPSAYKDRLDVDNMTAICKLIRMWPFH